MKLSDHLVQIKQAFALLMSSFDDIDPIGDYYRLPASRRVRRDLPKNRTFHDVPKLIPTYPPPPDHHFHKNNKETLLLIAAFEATYHNLLTPIIPDMVPIVIDTGASITVTPYKTDFITPIRPVQAIEIKGIASGLQVAGYGDISYNFHNDYGELQQVTLKDCL
jgi:hypothetical protein